MQESTRNLVLFKTVEMRTDLLALEGAPSLLLPVSDAIPELTVLFSMVAARLRARLSSSVRHPQSSGSGRSFEGCLAGGAALKVPAKKTPEAEFGSSAACSIDCRAPQE